MISDKFFSDEPIRNILLNSLTDYERIVIEGLYLKKLSEKKISQALDQDKAVKISTVKKLHKSAMVKIEDLLSFLDDED